MEEYITKTIEYLGSIGEYDLAQKLNQKVVEYKQKEFYQNNFQQ